MKEFEYYVRLKDLESEMDFINKTLQYMQSRKDRVAREITFLKCHPNDWEQISFNPFDENKGV